jgi:hypothetical protein
MDHMQVWANNLGGLGPLVCQRYDNVKMDCPDLDGSAPLWGESGRQVLVMQGVTNSWKKKYEGHCSNTPELPESEWEWSRVDMIISNQTEYRAELRDLQDIADTGGIKLNGIKTRNGILQKFGVINVVSPSTVELAFDFVFPFDNGPEDYDDTNEDQCEYIAEVPLITITYYDFDCGGSMPNLENCDTFEQYANDDPPKVCDVCESISAWGGGQHNSILYESLSKTDIDDLINEERENFPYITGTSNQFSPEQLKGSFWTVQVTNTTQLHLTVDTHPNRVSWASNTKIVCVEREKPFQSFIDADEDTAKTTDDQTPTTVFINKYQLQPIDPSKPVGFLKATATQRGTGRDNPLSTQELSKLQLDRSITFAFKQANRMAIVEEVLQMDEATNFDNDGRNFLFSFVDPVREICDAWRQPPSPPSHPQGSGVEYTVQQRYWLAENIWGEDMGGFAAFGVPEIKQALVDAVLEGLKNVYVGTEVSSVTVTLPQSDAAPERLVEPAQALMLSFKTAVHEMGGAVSLDAYFNLLANLNRGVLSREPEVNEETGEMTVPGFGMVADGLPTYDARLVYDAPSSAPSGGR